MEDDDRDMPVCFWPEQRRVEYRPVPGWDGRYRIGDDRSVWHKRTTGWRMLTPRVFPDGRPAVVLRHEGREITRSTELLYRAAWSRWPERWIERIGPTMLSRSIPRPPVPRPVVAPAIEPAVIEVVKPVRPVPIVDDDDDDRPRRGLKGTAHGRAVLDNRKVIEARSLHAAGFGLNALAKRYGCHRLTIYYAVSGRTWTHLPMPASRKSFKRPTIASPQRARDLSNGGLSIAEIAEEMEISTRTVRRYLD